MDRATDRPLSFMSFAIAAHCMRMHYYKFRHQYSLQSTKRYGTPSIWRQHSPPPIAKPGTLHALQGPLCEDSSALDRELQVLPLNEAAENLGRRVLRLGHAQVRVDRRCSLATLSDRPDHKGLAAAAVTGCKDALQHSRALVSTARVPPSYNHSRKSL